MSRKSLVHRQNADKTVHGWLQKQLSCPICGGCPSSAYRALTFLHDYTTLLI
jgi:hypothetical protein